MPDDGNEEHRENGGYNPEPECIREVVAGHFAFAGGGDECLMPIDEQARGSHLPTIPEIPKTTLFCNNFHFFLLKVLYISKRYATFAYGCIRMVAIVYIRISFNPKIRAA